MNISTVVGLVQKGCNTHELTNIFCNLCQQGRGLLLGGGAWSRVVSWGGGECLVETAPQTATAAGGMHPTGMHSCIISGSTKLLNIVAISLCT